MSTSRGCGLPLRVSSVSEDLEGVPPRQQRQETTVYLMVKSDGREEFALMHLLLLWGMQRRKVLNASTVGDTSGACRRTPGPELFFDGLKAKDSGLFAYIPPLKLCWSDVM
jgi:hypothetical protein